MKPSSLRTFVTTGVALCALATVGLPLSAGADAAAPRAAKDTASPATSKYKTNLPPSAELRYTIKARQHGLRLDGSATVHWHAAGTSFSVATETRAKLLGKIQYAHTEGLIDEYGLAPLRFSEKRFSKPPTATSFDRASHTIRFSASDETYPITGGEQDRNSIVWQLVAVARAAPAKFKPGSEWTFFVAGQRDAENWIFKVLARERLRTPLGELDTVLIKRLPPEGKGQQLDIWLAPQRDWYPVRLRFSDDNGDHVDQMLENVTKKSS